MNELFEPFLLVPGARNDARDVRFVCVYTGDAIELMSWRVAAPGATLRGGECGQASDACARDDGDFSVSRRFS